MTKMKNLLNKLALVTMLVLIMFTFSCGGKGDNPVDNCKYCNDELEDNSCIDGSECGGEEITVPSAADIETIGNYQFPNFPDETGMIDQQVKTLLSNTQSYMNVMLGNLEASLKDNPEARAYFDDYIKNLSSIEYASNNTTGIDPVINDLNACHKPIFVEIVKHINTPLNQNRFIRYYKAFDVKMYEEGWGSNFNDDAKYECDKQKEEVNNEWIGLHRVTGAVQPFDIEADMNNGYTKISQEMDELLAQAAANIGHGVTAENLRIIKNGSNIIKYLDARHDFYGRALHEMSSCVSLEQQGTIAEAMDEVAPLTQTNMVMNERSL